MTARLIVFLLACVCRSVAAENPAFSAGLMEIEFNPGKSTVQFALGALLHTVHGSFKVKEGSVRFDPDSGRASGQILVDVKSGETGDRARDREMHNNVLESSRFPDAYFYPDYLKGRLASSGASKVEVHGFLSVHGGKHEMTIPVVGNVQGDQVTATAKFVLPYVAWGMKDPSNLVLRVDKTVSLEVSLSGTVTVHARASAGLQPERRVSLRREVWDRASVARGSTPTPLTGGWNFN